MKNMPLLIEKAKLKEIVMECGIDRLLQLQINSFGIPALRFLVIYRMWLMQDFPTDELFEGNKLNKFNATNLFDEFERILGGYNLASCEPIFMDQGYLGYWNRINRKIVLFLESDMKLGKAEKLYILNFILDWYDTIQFYTNHLLSESDPYLREYIKALNDKITQEYIIKRSRVDPQIVENYNKYNHLLNKPDDRETNENSKSDKPQSKRKPLSGEQNSNEFENNYLIKINDQKLRDQLIKKLSIFIDEDIQRLELFGSLDGTAITIPICFKKSANEIANIIYKMHLENEKCFAATDAYLANWMSEIFRFWVNNEMKFTQVKSSTLLQYFSRLKSELKAQKS